MTTDTRADGEGGWADVQHTDPFFSLPTPNPADGALAEALAELRDETTQRWNALDFNGFADPYAGHIATILNAVLSGQLIPLETCNARVAAMVEAAYKVAAKVARGQYASNSKYDVNSPFYGMDLDPDRSEWGRGKDRGREDAAAAIRALTPADHTAALDAMISRAREVKPLVWVAFGQECIRAKSVLGRYEIMWGFHNDQTSLDVPAPMRTHTWHPTLEAAKAAAQADYTARIHAALRANAMDASEGER